MRAGTRKAESLGYSPQRFQTDTSQQRQLVGFAKYRLLTLAGYNLTFRL